MHGCLKAAQKPLYTSGEASVLTIDAIHVNLVLRHNTCLLWELIGSRRKRLNVTRLRRLAHRL